MWRRVAGIPASHGYSRSDLIKLTGPDGNPLKSLSGNLVVVSILAVEMAVSRCTVYSLHVIIQSWCGRTLHHHDLTICVVDRSSSRILAVCVCVWGQLIIGYPIHL